MARARPEPPSARITSLASGRVRLNLGAAGRDPARATALARDSLLLPGVVSAVANPLTGSLLLRFRGEAETVFTAAARRGLFRVCPHTAAPSSPARAAPVAAAALALLAVFQALRGAVLPPAVTLLWYAASIGRDDGEAAGD
ncbi:MAG: hypothetical protein NZ523_00790 [Elioraea sp.]|nr:hypothetical protein [Elioraea sp.]MDW8443213.1 hypothetical protein [Acetobacteraceae bacterium]